MRRGEETGEGDARLQIFTRPMVFKKRWFDEEVGACFGLPNSFDTVLIDWQAALMTYGIESHFTR